MKKYTAIVAVLLVLAAPLAEAGILRISFGGQITHSLPDDGTTVYDTAFSGFYLIDTDVPDDRPQADNGAYFDAVVGGAVIWDGITYDYTPGLFNAVFVLNDSAGFDDLFFAAASFTNAAGIEYSMALTFRDYTQTVFSNDAIPDGFSLSQFGDFDPTDVNSTGLFLGNTLPGFQGPLSFAVAELLTVPTPTTVWLMLAAMLAWRVRSRS